MKLGFLTGGLATMATLASALSCHGTPPLASPDPLPPSASASSAPGEIPDHAAPKPAPVGRAPSVTVLAAPSPVTLPTEIRPVASQSAALLVHSEPLQGYSYVRRIDAKHAAGELRALPDRHPVTLLEGKHPLLVTSRGQDLCFERLDEAKTPACHRLRADFVVLVDGAPMLLEQRDEKVEETAPAPKPQRRRRGARAPKKQKPQQTIPVRLWAHRFDADGNAKGDAIDTGLVVSMPLPGMGVIAAAPTKAGIRVIHYESAKARRDGRRSIPQAKLMSALLGRDGKLVNGTAREIYRGDRAYGHIEGHREPRLFSSRVLVGRFIDAKAQPVTTRWEARRLGPVREVAAPNAVLGVDPWRLANPKVVGASELEALTKIYDAAPRLAVGQPASEAGRVAWVGDRGFFVKKDTGKLSSASRADGSVRAEAEPFIAQRSRVSWATLRLDGSGLAQTHLGLVEVRPSGTHEVISDKQHHVASPPARIGDAWWAVVPRGATPSGGAVVRLSSSPEEAASLAAHAYTDMHVLVGGEKEGMFIALEGRRLTTWRLTSDGTATRLSTFPTSIARGLSGAGRRGGGAVVLGRSALTDSAVSVAIDAGGRPIGEETFQLKATGRLDVLPVAAGVVVLDEARSQVAWLDDDGKHQGTHAWTEPNDRVACVDGVPARQTVPSATPGHFERIGKLAGNHCWAVPFPRRLQDGSHRWIGSAVDGADAKVVLATLTGEAKPAAAAAPPSTSGGAAKTSKPSPCPPDMVSIGGSFCIDRFETQLVDASDGLPLSPDYPATAGILGAIFKAYAARRWQLGDLRARAMPLPPLLRPAASAPKPAARSRYGVVPSGYMTWYTADQACAAAGKRLCTHSEWVTACRGQKKRKFPYGDDYAHGKCNIWRFAHPAAALHGNAAVGHLDPRLNRVKEGDRPLLHATGTTTSCASRWGDDAVYDMVGNLDEWIAEKKGAFAGGFYSRTTKKGCDAKISAHPKRYLDYSLGTRCCKKTRP